MAWTKSNQTSETLTNGVTVYVPIVALAYSYAVMFFRGSALNAGKQHKIICGDISLWVTLDEYGRAEVSLLPFIRQDVLDNDAMADPLAFRSAGFTNAPNKLRGQLTIDVLKEGETTAGDNDENIDVTLQPFYIFGDYSPLTPKTDYWRTYDSDHSTPMNYDAETIYDSATGVPTSLADFMSNWQRVKDVKGGRTPNESFTMVKAVCCYNGGTMRTQNVTWHYYFDCREDNVLAVRWLDHEGNINQRKFTIGARSQSGAIGQTWNVPHTTKVITSSLNDAYWHGADQWQQVTPQATITLGDDAIPIEQYDWLVDLATTVAVQVRIDDVWQRCNITGASVEADPRKKTFNISFSLTVPTYEAQQF